MLIFVSKKVTSKLIYEIYQHRVRTPRKRNLLLALKLAPKSPKDQVIKICNVNICFQQGHFEVDLSDVTT